jgi:uncharacterized protein (DUF58 family)
MKRFIKPAFLAVLGGLLYLIATSSGAGWLYVVAAAIGATVLISALVPLWNVRNIEVERRAPTVGTSGTPLPCSAEIHNTGWLARHMLEIKDDFAGDTGSGIATRLRRGGSESFDYAIENPRRGIYAGGEVTVESGAPFGLFFGRIRRHVPSNVVVYPRTFEVSALPRPEIASTGSVENETKSLRRGAGGEFWGVREYRPGDPARLIAWRRSASSLSSGRLTVIEMSQEQDSPLILSLNLDHRAPRAVLEMEISAAASLMMRALKEGREVVADAGPQRIPFPDNPDPDSLLTWCAGLEPSHAPKLSASVEILPSLNGVRTSGADTIILVSCAAFAGPGVWMTKGEEREFVERMEADGRRAVVLEPDVREPWSLS